ncbi:unnamed protein product [Rotaria sp. Silwood2]|nr:unnamed protein product [Rotaria sp. Silwood2]CAF2832133.1 unnamed protein product [Rotaria sp. Silwood2]CAF2976337.1 unnamed protein product [Rotaria sp. Silwood2]CAF4171460.1 unnamed protein product [Rotaria sp. Silwood2]CAF4266940.1 unnamed protein product [Rotaria sp. Silwood2]
MTMTMILHLIFYSVITATTISTIHPCYVKSYLEVLNLRDCLNSSIQIETTYCRGYCYSKDYLIYDWQSEAIPYRHQHYIRCCSPNITISREIKVICNDKQQRIIKYPFVQQCQCKFCIDDCVS